jgi:hypothetical protein
MLTFSPNKRIHIMKALSSLSKFCGCDDLWKQAIKRYNIKWSAGEGSLKVFDQIINGINYEDMLKKIKHIISNIPKTQANLFIFNTVTGSRPIEVFKSVYHIHNNLNEYWNKDKEILEHYKFANEFIRRTKKVYISVANQSIINITKECPVKQSYNALKLLLKRKGIDMNIYYCRKVFATYLKNKDIEPEIIDLLQGRISSSVFVNHYYRPDINAIIASKIKPALNSLSKIIESVG